ncbi:MAG: hypothetical protein FWE21_06740 [Defluviitaleaceae bacterium]|nr:hypothetical protein [Defluviitaleaceae bacterium]
MKKKIVASILTLTMVFSVSAVVMAGSFDSQPDYIGFGALSTHPDACNGGTGTPPPPDLPSPPPVNTPPVGGSKPVTGGRPPGVIGGGGIYFWWEKG